MNAVTRFFDTHSSDRVLARLMAGWERQLTKNTAKAAGLGLMAVSLAACGDSDSTDTGGGSGGGGGGGSTTTPVTVNGTDLDGAAYDGATDAGPTTIELKGNADPNVDAGEWISYDTLLIRDANGDFTITDLQASETDAADGTAGTDIALIDIGQNSAGITTLDYDAQAVDAADTVVNISMDEVAGTVILTGGAIETVNITVEDGANEASLLTDLQITGVTTLSIAGGVAGQEFTVAEALDTSITTLDGAAATGNLILDVTGGGSASYALGSGDDQLEMGNDYDDGDVVSGGAGADVVAMEFTTATIREGTMSGVETLNTVFGAAATFDGSNVTGLSTINLGLDGFDDPGGETASTADADFNDMSAEFTTLNIHDTQIDVEVDYVSGVAATLAINFDNDSGAITIGDDAGDDIQLIGVRDLSLNALTGNAVTIDGNINLNSDTELLTITTMMDGGDLTLNGQTEAFRNSDALTDVTVTALHGDMVLGTNDNFDFFEDASALQYYSVTANDAEIEAGKVGADFAAGDLEVVRLATVDEGTLRQDTIFADGSDISLFSVTASDKNTLFDLSTSDFFNVSVSSLRAEEIERIEINALDGGDVVLNGQRYTAGEMVFTGTGDIRIVAQSTIGSDGFIQTEAADASSHSGSRDFVDGFGNDIFYGSTGDDTITLTHNGPPLAQTDVYFDSDGSDTLIHTSIILQPVLTVYDDGSADLTDTGTSTDDTYTLVGTLGSGTTANVKFYAGGGNDQLTLNIGGILVDFADYDSGVLHLEDFTRNLGAVPNNDTMSFDGLTIDGSTFTMGSANNQGIGTNLNGATAPVTNINSNAIYVVVNGDAASGGAIAGATIADYTNMTDVADYLDAITGASGSSGDMAIFVVNNLTTSAATGDDHDAYVYVYVDDGNGAGIQASELTLISTLDTNAALTGNDIV